MKIFPKKVIIRRRRWLLQTSKKLPRTVNGLCSHPDSLNKSIAIRDSLRGEKMLEVLIHEATHAGHWDMSEEAVEEFSHDVSRILWRLGYRGPWDH